VNQAMPVAPTSSDGPVHTATATGILRRPVMRADGAVANISTMGVRSTPVGPVVTAQPQSPLIQTWMGETRPQSGVDETRPQSGPTVPRPDESALVPVEVEPAKKGLPLWAWIGIGVGGVGLLGGLIYFLTRKKPPAASAGLGSVTITSPHEIPPTSVTPIYVLADDRFLSGWGPAHGRTNTVILPCASSEEAQIVSDNARGRSDMRNIRVVRYKKPRLSSKVMYSLMSKADAPRWYQPGGFTRGSK